MTFLVLLALRASRKGALPASEHMSNLYTSRPPRTPRPRQSGEAWEEDRPVLYELTVDDTDEYVETEILGADGNKLWRRNRWPIGFHQDHD